MDIYMCQILLINSDLYVCLQLYYDMLRFGFLGI